VTTVDETVAAWRAAAEAGDAEAARRCVSADVEVVSPLTAAFRFHGPDQLRDMLAAAFQVLPDLRVHTEVGDGDTRVLFFHGTIDGLPVEEAQLLRFDADGLVRELTIFGRPLPALTAVLTGIGGPLLRRQGRPVLGRLIGAATAPLAALTRIGEKRLVPLADPARSRR
jgi:hypothetical protein